MNQVEDPRALLSIAQPFPGPAFALSADIPGPGVDAGDAGEVLDASRGAIEVKVLWGGDVVQVAHVTSGRAFTLGESGCDFALPREVVGSARMPFVSGRGGRLWLTLPAGASGQVRARREAARTVADLISAGDAVPSREYPGAHELALEAGAKARIELAAAHVAFELAYVRAGMRARVGLLAAEGTHAHGYTALSALMHGALVASLAFFLPAMKGADGEAIDRDEAAAMAPYLTAIAEREREPRDEPAFAQGTRDPSGGAGGAAKGESGTLGSQLAKAGSDARYAVRGSPDNTDPHLARARERLEVETFGMISILEGSRENAPIAPWGERDASGKDSRSALGNMWGTSLDDAFGAGEIGLAGVGERGGGTCDGCVGLGGIASLDHGLGDGLGPAIGAGHGHAVLPSTYAPKGIRMRMGETQVDGGQIPAEVIQRIVRQNFGRFRMCYEDGLRTNPSIGGRVAVKFVIDRQGAVSLASDGGSDLPDQGVIGCVVRGFQSLSFPEPKGGVVKVTYPIVFAPGERER